LVYVQNDPVNGVDLRGLCVEDACIGETILATGIIYYGAKAVQETWDSIKDNSEKCEEDPCKEHEKICIGTAKAAEKHNYGTSSNSPHMHPGICDNLASIKIR